jgi:hypothetical protein
MLLYAVASSLGVHGDTSSDGSERSLDSPEALCSIGFQPVFCRTKKGPTTTTRRIGTI